MRFVFPIIFEIEKKLSPRLKMPGAGLKVFNKLALRIRSLANLSSDIQVL